MLQPTSLSSIRRQPFVVAGRLFSLILSVVLLQAMAVIAQASNAPKEMQWTIAGQPRKALVYIPATAKTKPTPIIFTFHGHGGNMGNMYRMRQFDQLWPGAIFICPQGIPRVGKLTDPEGRLPGWDMTADNSNTDLQFFDAMLKTLKSDYKIDDNRIYATGHSNGGGFTYLLWAMREDIFAAVAPSASTAAQLTLKLRPKPAMHIMGEADPLVKPEWQRATYNYLLKLNHCDTNAEKLGPYIMRYTSASGNPVLLYIHPGGHQYPKDANKYVIDFFKSHSTKP